MLPRSRTIFTHAGTIAVATAVAVASACVTGGSEPMAGVSDAAGTAQHSLQVGDRQRTFVMHVPANRPRRLGRAVAYPLVIVLHGSGADGETVRRMSGMDALAESARFLVVYPNGTTGLFGLRSDWNAGECCGTAESRNVDDVAFIRALVENIGSRLPLDRDRIFVAGFSDGGRMTYRIACEMSTQVAAIAVVSGSLADAHCAPKRKVPLIAFHGTDDHDVPYADTSYTAATGALVPAAQQMPPAIQFWAAANGCRTMTLARKSAHVTQAKFDRCAADVEFFTVEEGRHAWPGGTSDGQEPTRELSASAEAWRFFARHPLK